MHCNRFLRRDLGKLPVGFCEDRCLDAWAGMHSKMGGGLLCSSLVDRRLIGVWGKAGSHTGGGDAEAGRLLTNKGFLVAVSQPL